MIRRPRNKNCTRYYSDRQEKKVAKTVGGKQTPNSGSTSHTKGDVLTDTWCFECKVHMESKEKFTIHKEWIDKNREEAFQMGRKHAALVLDFGDGEQHYIISEKDFLEYINYLKGSEDGEA